MSIMLSVNAEVAVGGRSSLGRPPAAAASGKRKRGRTDKAAAAAEDGSTGRGGGGGGTGGGSSAVQMRARTGDGGKRKAGVLESSGQVDMHSLNSFSTETPVLCLQLTILLITFAAEVHGRKVVVHLSSLK